MDELFAVTSIQRPALTKSQVNKAGKILRRAGRGQPVDPILYEGALQVLFDYRAVHRLPLTKATMGLRSMVATEGCSVEVSQRLKRVPTILDKLQREPTMQLANMQDIAGCRGVLADTAEVRRVQRRLSRNRPPIRVNDYIEHPRATGYRGVHAIVQYDERTIEVQLRTAVMHDWAIAVERLAGRMGPGAEDLKSGLGPREIVELMEAISEAMALEEAGQEVDSSLVDRIDRLRPLALPYLRGPRP
jgi:ppGpp synthetase/RelA/SpoT-type nucleotidyltranferase